MFSLMGNCFSCIKQKREPKRLVTLAILGLDSAGKTTTTKALLGDNLETAPTVGFNREEIDFKNYHFTVYDLGGGKKIRDIWKDYLPEVYGVIYVVDTTARDRIPEVRDNLKGLLEHEQIREKPLLLLANKEDVPDHMDDVDVMEGLNLENLVNQNKCPCKMEMCSAIKGTGKKVDVNIKNGMTWLCSILDQLYDKLKIRVDQDVKVMKERQEREREERKERVRKIREERERKEKEEREKLGIPEVEEEDDDDDIVQGDPFKRLTAEEIQRKDEKYKKAKAKDKERRAKLEALESSDIPGTTVTTETEDDGLRAPRSSRSLLSYGLFNGGFNTHGSPRISDNLSARADDEDRFVSPQRGRQLLPPLQSPIGTKFMNDKSDNSNNNAKSEKKKNKKSKQKASSGMEMQDHSYENHVEDEDGETYGKSAMSVSRIQVTSQDDGSEEELSTSEQFMEKTMRSRDSKKMYQTDEMTEEKSPNSGRKKKGRLRKAKQQPDTGEDFDTLRLSQHFDEEFGHRNDERTAPPPGRGENTAYSEERSVTPVKKLKKKKKKLLRKNNVAPSDDEFELSDVQNSPARKQALPWVKTPSPRKMLEDEDAHNTNAKWSLAEDLPTVVEPEPVRRLRPNFDSEDDLVL